MESYAAVAALYSQIGSQRKADEAYSLYAKIVEKFYGNNSTEAAACFYCIGVFYLQQGLLEKSKKCFEKAIYIWTTTLRTEYNPSIADCHYNLSIIYKKQNFKEIAEGEIVKCIKIRKEAIGNDSLPLASAYEHYAKLLFEAKSYKRAMHAVDEAYNIRRNKFTNPSHPDLVRISTLAIYFYKEIAKQSEEYLKRNPKEESFEASTDQFRVDDGQIDFNDLNKLIRARLLKDKQKKNVRINEPLPEDMEYTVNESAVVQTSYHNLSESKNISEIVNDGIGTLFSLFKKEDKICSNPHVTTFVLSLTDAQLEWLNNAIDSIYPTPTTSIREIDQEFISKLVRIPLRI